MRDTIDFGIDLGTTNSAIAVAEDGDVTVIKNNDNQEITPSAVWIPRKDQIFVGAKAREYVHRDPENATAEFKLLMGQADAGKHFAKAGVTLTPQQLSAEILKSLRADAERRGKGLPDCAVITVPAAFTLNQNKATTEAAELAGLGSACPLIPEPTAAAFAYGIDDSVDRGHWLVFDFGGGTFDAAVVSKCDGELRVLNHAGDPYLGGKLIDWALVERVLAPAAAAQLGLSEFRRDNPRWQQNFARLKAAAERAKIELSLKNETYVIEELRDEHGNWETFDFTLSRAALDSVAEPFYLRAINLCRTALTDAALDADDIDRLLLVGGTTLAPGLRELLADPQQGLGVPLDFSVDPTTVVARGAAIFASTLRRPRAAQPAAPAHGEFTVSLVYEPRVSTPTTTVAGTLHSASTVDWSRYGVTISNPAGRPPFRSPRVTPNARGAFVVEISLDVHRTSQFTIELTDNTGAHCVVSPSTFSITHGTELGGVTLGHSLGVQLHDGTFAPMLHKGTPLPKTHTETFTTAAALRRSDTRASVRIPLVQGERRRGDRNREVGVLEIRPRDLRIDLPQGSEIEVTFTVDTSNLLTVVADVPLLDAQFEAKIDMSGIRAQAPEVLEVQLVDTLERLESLRAQVARGDSPEAATRLARLEQEGAAEVAKEQVKAAAVDPSAAKYAEERIRDIQAELDDVEDALRLSELAQELQDLLNELEPLVNQVGTPGDRQEFIALTRSAHDAIRSQDATAVRKQIDRGVALLIELERRSPDWPVKLFHILQVQVGQSPQAAALLHEGQRAVVSGDIRTLNRVNQELVRLIPPEERTGRIGYIGVERKRWA